jgi:hypothetical protein
MKEAEYAITKSDKVQRILSLIAVVVIYALELSDGLMLFWYPSVAAPVLAATMVWFSDTLGTSLPWRTAPRDIRVVGWGGLLLSVLIQVL